MKSGSTSIGWLFSSFLLQRSIFIEYLMAFMFICSAKVLVCCLGILYILLISFMNFLCVLPRAPAVSTRIGSTFQPWALMLFKRLPYFTIFSWIFSGEYLSLQYVNSMNCIVKLCCGHVWRFTIVWKVSYA
jgi:hypothetical protein